MSKVITFSRTFPSYHPKAGQPTYFVEQIWNGFRNEYFELTEEYLPFIREYQKLKRVGEHLVFGGCKHHTIRAGHRFKVGEWFKPAVWGDDINPKSGRKGPYHSKQIQFAPEIQVKKVWDVEFNEDGEFWIFSDKERGPKVLHTVAKNDGLTKDDMMAWFNKAFTGQIICWNENINY